MKTMNFFWNWLISKHEHVQLTAIDEFKLSLKTTAKCRFKAGIRVRKQGRFAYFSSILSSLCLIFISLLAMTDITLHFNVDIINVMQVFLAVSVLVYSVLINASNYEYRYDTLTDNANTIKQIHRTLEVYSDKNAHNIDPEKLSHLQNEYSEILKNSENHTPTDFRLVKSEMYEYKITGIPWVWNMSVAFTSNLIGSLLPLLLLFFQLFFISDMLGITSIMTPILN